MRTSICEFCGEEFEVKSDRGILPKICYKEKCRLIKEDNHRTYMRNKRREYNTSWIAPDMKNVGKIHQDMKKGGDYLNYLSKDEKKDWSDWKPTNTKGEVVNTTTVHS